MKDAEILSFRFCVKFTTVQSFFGTSFSPPFEFDFDPLAAAAVPGTEGLEDVEVGRREVVGGVVNEEAGREAEESFFLDDLVDLFFPCKGGPRDGS